jgi:hypothetical protein
MLAQKFDITAKVVSSTEVKSGSAENDVKISNPIIPEKPLTKDDICEAIEKKVFRAEEKRGDLVTKIRNALERKFGQPSLEW